MNDSNATPKILFTTELDKEQRDLLGNFEYKVQAEPFIFTEYHPLETWLSTIPNGYDSWIFTSKKAVKAIAPIISDLPIPPFIFAVGEKTAEKLEELSLKSIIPKEYNLISLAEKMNDYKLNRLIHFCGNRKAGDLKQLLDYSEIVSIEVYKTELISKKVDVHAFDGVVFMSPSAVKSFHQENEVPAQTTVFSIGPSTAKIVEEFNIKNSVQAEIATLESLAETIQNYFNTCPQIN